MPLSFQEGVRQLLQKNRKNRQSLHDVSSSDFSTTSVAESTASWPPPSTTRRKESSTMSGLVHAFGNCFAPAKNEQEDAKFGFQDVSVNFSNDGSLHSVGLMFSSNGKLENTSGVVIFKMTELIKATNNFSPSLKIGQGGFGTVYKGRLMDGRLVAIKRAKKNTSDQQLSAEYQNELATLSNIEHLNLVKFIGYTEEGPERILVVEYVANGNLREHLDGQYGGTLDLATRLDIAIDVAHAITYLHMYTDRPIIHRDIKSSNILLTENFRAKVADFGFSRLGPLDVNATHVSTQVKGTAGYLDPEYLKTYQLTEKSDVYSFGVLLVELFTGRRPIEQKREIKERITTRWVALGTVQAFQMFLDGKGIEVLDPKLDRSPTAFMMIEKLLELGFQCAAPSKQERPSMKKTAEVLWNIRKDYRSFWQDRSGVVLSNSNSQRE